MRYLSVCSGIEAASVAWPDWEPVAFSEIEAFPSAVLAHHYPDTPNWGDITKFKEWPDATVDVIVGGTPCQSFSVAGLRGGLADPRGSLALTYLAIADRYRPRWVVWENVPGVLSTDGGRAFGAFLGGLAELGYGFAYRILDAQYFGLAQRRKRVFVVGYLGDWRRAAAVLFESASLRGDSAPSRETGQRVAATITAGVASGAGHDELSRCLNAGGMGRQDYETETLIPVGGGFDAIAFAQNTRDEVRELGGNIAGAIAAEPGMKQQTYVAFHNRQDPDVSGPVTHPLGAKDNGLGLGLGAAVRRLTPRECEKLQGFSPDYTLVPYRNKPAADGPRYKALGNSMAVPVITWLGQRIAMVEGFS